MEQAFILDGDGRKIGLHGEFAQLYHFTIKSTKAEPTAAQQGMILSKLGELAAELMEGGGADEAND